MKIVKLTKRSIYTTLVLLLFCFISNYVTAQEPLLEKIRHLKSKPDFNPENTLYIDALIDLAIANIQSDSIDIIIKEAYDLSINTGYRIGETKALSTYGYYFSEKGEIKKAYEYNMNALEVANSYNLYNEKITALNNMGIDFYFQGDYANALLQYLEALAVSKKIESTPRISSINNNIALLYDTNGDFETALSFYKVASEYSIKNDNQISLGGILSNMAAIYNMKEDFVEAERLINSSIEIFEKQKNTSWLAKAYRGKADIALKKRNFKVALKWYRKSEKLCNEIDYDIGYSLVYNGIGESYLELNNLDAAEEYALKGLQISEKVKGLKDIESANLILSKIYFEKGEIDKAYEYQSEYITLYEKGSAEKFKKGLGVLRSKMEFENQKKHLIEENNKALAKQKWYVYLSLAALLIVSIILALIFRTQRLQKKFTAELSDSNKTKDKLFSVIAHDLRGPINSFYSLMKLYMDKEFSKEETEHLFPKAMDDIGNISDMLNNLLLWAKTQMQGTTIKQENIDVNNIANDNVLLLSPLAEKKGIRISNNIAEDILSFSDRDHIDIVLRNLISNAIKFTNSNGEININAIQLNSELQIEVSDNGVGMDLETQSKLFAKNNTKSTYGTNNEKGTGLGLSLCRDMVESNGGKIWVKSIKDKGTSIFFTMPIKKESLKAV